MLPLLALIRRRLLQFLVSLVVSPSFFLVSTVSLTFIYFQFYTSYIWVQIYIIGLKNLHITTENSTLLSLGFVLCFRVYVVVIVLLFYIFFLIIITLQNCSCCCCCFFLPVLMFFILIYCFMYQCCQLLTFLYK